MLLRATWCLSPMHGVRYFILLALTHSIIYGQTSKRILCYYANWSEERNIEYRLYPKDIDVNLCTHVVYAFAMADLKQGIVPMDFLVNLTEVGAVDFLKLKKEKPDLQFILSVGGWDEGSVKFSRIASDPDKRKWFAEYACGFIRAVGFDGIDINWQWPGLREGSNSADKRNFPLFLAEMRSYFEYEGRQTKRKRLTVSIVAPPVNGMIEKGFNMDDIMRHIDFLNLLTMEYHTSTEPIVTHPAPLHSTPKHLFDADLTVEATVEMYLKMGIKANKMNLAIPLYGLSYLLENPVYNAIGDFASDEGMEGFGTKSPGALAYYEICKYIKDDGWFVEHPNRTAMGPYAYHDKNWVAYDDKDMVRRKVLFANRKGLGGLMLWTIDLDDFKGMCGEVFPLTRTARETLLEFDDLEPTTEVSDIDSTFEESLLNRKPSLSSNVSSQTKYTADLAELLGAHTQSTSTAKSKQTFKPTQKPILEINHSTTTKNVPSTNDFGTSNHHSYDMPDILNTNYQSEREPQLYPMEESPKQSPARSENNNRNYVILRANQNFIIKTMRIVFNKNHYYNYT